MKVPFLLLFSGCAALAACNRAEAPSTRTDSATPSATSDRANDTSMPATGTGVTGTSPNSTGTSGTNSSATGDGTGVGPGIGNPPPIDDRPGGAGSPP